VPDLLVEFPSLGRVLGETKIGASWDDSAVRAQVEAEVDGRFRDPRFSYIDFAFMVVYPASVAERAARMGESAVKTLLETSKIGVGLTPRPLGVNGSDFRFSRSWYPRPVYPSHLPQVIEELAHDIGGFADPERVIAQLVSLIEQAATYAQNSLLKGAFTKFWDEVSSYFRIQLEVGSNREQEYRRDLAYFCAKTLFVFLTIAMIVYELARERFLQLTPLSIPLGFGKLADALEELGRINYLEVVEVKTVASKVPPDTTLTRILSQLYVLVRDNILVFRRFGWENLAMIYQRLLSESFRKAFATFYTKLPAARLLAELVIDEPEDRVIDPACGTGSLLLSSFYVRQFLYLDPKHIGRLEGEGSILEASARRVLEATWGIDALQAAIALSAGSLSIASLAVPREPLNLYVSPVTGGVKGSRAGSLDLLVKENRRIKGSWTRRVENQLGQFDVVIMNPPFTRSDRISNLIGGRARELLQATDLKFGGVELTNIFAAGFAKPFLALADRLIGRSGRIAAVLPTSILSRPEWADVRRGLVRNYTLRYLVISWAPRTPNFSSDTDLREILVVLQRGRRALPARVISLAAPIDGFTTRDVVLVARTARRGSGVVMGRDNILAEIVEIPQSFVRTYQDNLYRLVAFSKRELLEWHLRLLVHAVPLGSLFNLGSLVDHRDGLQVLDLSEVESVAGVGLKAPAFWGSGCEVVNKPLMDEVPHLVVAVAPNRVKTPFWYKKGKLKGKLKESFLGDLFIIRRGQLDTQAAVLFSLKEGKAISNVWWPLHPKRKISKEVIYALLTFINSAFGFLHLLGERLETRGLWVEYKKGHLETMPIPNLCHINVKKHLPPIEVLTKPSLRFSDYLRTMARLESELGNWYDAANRAIDECLPEAPRAHLDLHTYRLLHMLDPDLEPPSRLYTLLWEESRRLKQMMAAGISRQKGQTGGRKRIQDTPLEWWLTS
jgi:hypothetical protein